MDAAASDAAAATKERRSREVMGSKVPDGATEVKPRAGGPGDRPFEGLSEGSQFRLVAESPMPRNSKRVNIFLWPTQICSAAADGSLACAGSRRRMCSWSCAESAPVPSYRFMRLVPSRLAALLLFAVFALNGVVPSLRHNCVVSMPAVEAHHEPGAHHHGGQQDGGVPSPCRCIDHACCPLALALPTAAAVLGQGLEASFPVPTFAFRTVEPFTSRYLLPPALAPPVSV